MMRFITPDWLYLAVPVLVLLTVLIISAGVRRKKILAMLAGNSSDRENSIRLSVSRRYWRYLLFAGTLILLVIAAARPYFSAKLLPFEPKGRDLVFLFDVSKSMNATDIAPSRMKHAKYCLRELSRTERGDRMALVAFAGSAFLSCPLTSDPVTFNEYVEDLSTGSVPVGGTNLELALKTAQKAFKASEGSNRAVIIFTDGEELQGRSTALLEELKKQKIPLFVVGVGDPDTGAPVPKGGREEGFIRDSSGRIVTSRLNEAALRRLAEETGGIYVRTSVTDPGMRRLEEAISRLDREGRKNISRRTPVDDFPKVLLAALVLLILYLLISERGRRSAAAVLMLMMPLLTGAAGEVKSEEKKTELVMPDAPEARYNLARKIQDSGREGFEKIYEELLNLPESSVELRSKSFHNLANARHRVCRSSLSTAEKQVGQQQLDPALKSLEEAEKQAAAAGELYANSTPGSRFLPELPANLTRLDRDRQKIAELKKKIEELKKQQQKAQQQTQQANQQNRQKPSGSQQAQQQMKQRQQQSIEQAKKETGKLQQQAGEMRQQQMAEAAAKALDHLKKAEEAGKKNDDRTKEKELEKALESLGGGKDLQDKNKQQQKESENNSGREEKKQNGSPQTQPQQQDKRDWNRKNAEQLLDMMGEEDKKLRDAMKQRNMMRRPRVEKDW